MHTRINAYQIAIIILIIIKVYIIKDLKANILIKNNILKPYGIILNFNKEIVTINIY